MHIQVDLLQPEPPYAQIRDQVVAGIRSGELPVGARLPTVRALADELGLAVNTVAKAYRELEAEGHVITAGRNGTFVADPAQGTPPYPVTVAAARFADVARRQGLALEEAVGLLRRSW